MDRRFVTWLLVVSACLIVSAAASVFVSRIAAGAEQALRTSLLFEGPLVLADAVEEPAGEHLALLLRATLRAGQPEVALALLQRQDLVASYPVYAAAALFELGEYERSHAVWEGEGASGFERRLRLARDLGGRGMTDLVRDRRGRLLGGFLADGTFETVPGVPAEVVPPLLLARLRDERPFAGRRLSIDLEASLLARDALRGNRGSIVLLDASSGDVLAAVSDARSWAEGGAPAFEERREPASIAKLLTTSAALRAGIDPDATIATMRCRGALRLDGELLYCSSIDGPLRGLAHALAVSCNVAFGELGLLVGDEPLREEYRRFGFAVGDEPGHPYFGRVHRLEHDPLALANLAIGLDEADITPLHAASMAAAMARGDLLTPRLLHALDGRLGLSPRPHQTPALDGATSRPGLLSRRFRLILHRAMAAVVSRGGTAAHVAPHGFPVIMKTGTGRDPGRYFHVNYIGAGPASDPEIAFAVRLTDGRTSRRVRRAAYETTRRLLAGLGAAGRGRRHDPVTFAERVDPLPHDGETGEVRHAPAGDDGGIASAGQ